MKLRDDIKKKIPLRTEIILYAPGSGDKYHLTGTIYFRTIDKQNRFDRSGVPRKFHFQPEKRRNRTTNRASKNPKQIKTTDGFFPVRFIRRNQLQTFSPLFSKKKKKTGKVFTDQNGPSTLGRYPSRGRD